MDARGLRQARRQEIERRALQRTAAGRNTETLARWRRFRRRVGNWLLGLFAPALLRLLAVTWRVQRRGGPGWQLLTSNQPWLVAMWHGRMLVGLPMAMHRGRNIGVLVSPSDDGNLATRALRLFGYVSIRGSLSRGGARALREMTDTLQAGHQLVVTPDGPRGPRHSMNVGLHWLARKTGAPILPVGFACDRAWRLRSWDRFTIPKPFARLVVNYGDPQPIAAAASDGDLEALAAKLRTRLIALEREAFAALGTAPDFEGEELEGGNSEDNEPRAKENDLGSLDQGDPGRSSTVEP
jgi:lysophospholipid acyltransferase (LPLAT)-like uncharacterized protein